MIGCRYRHSQFRSTYHPLGNQILGASRERSSPSIVTVIAWETPALGEACWPARVWLCWDSCCSAKVKLTIIYNSSLVFNPNVRTGCQLTSHLSTVRTELSWAVLVIIPESLYKYSISKIYKKKNIYNFKNDCVVCILK